MFGKNVHTMDINFMLTATISNLQYKVCPMFEDKLQMYKIYEYIETQSKELIKELMKYLTNLDKTKYAHSIKDLDV